MAQLQTILTEAFFGVRNFLAHLCHRSQSVHKFKKAPQTLPPETVLCNVCRGPIQRQGAAGHIHRLRATHFVSLQGLALHV